MRSLVGAFWPVCLREWLDDLTVFFPEGLFEAPLPEVFAEVFAGVFAEVFAAAVAGTFVPVFLAGDEAACWLLDGELGAVVFFFPALVDVAFAWPNPAGTPSPANVDVSSTRSAGRSTLISFGCPSDAFK
jgi:hypothetical protein